MKKDVTIYQYSIINGEFRKYVYATCAEPRPSGITYVLQKKSSSRIRVQHENLDKASKNHIFTLTEDDDKNFSLLLEIYEKRVEEHRRQLEKEEKFLQRLKEGSVLGNVPSANQLVEQIMEFEPSTRMITGWLDSQGYNDVYSFDSGREKMFLWDKKGLMALSTEKLAKLLEGIQLF